MGIYNVREGDKHADNVVAYIADVDGNLPSNFSGVLIQATIHFSVTPQGNLIDPASSTVHSISSTIPLRILISDTSPVNFAASQPLNGFDSTFTFAEGDPNNYPLDLYLVSLGVIATTVNTTSNSTIPIPVAMIIQGALQSWRLHFNLVEEQFHLMTSGNLQKSPNLTVEVIRSYTTKIFSFFTLIVMWALSVAILALAITLWTRDRKVEPPTIVVATSMLFSLPAIRNAQPGAPPVGCTSDVIGFFWCMLIVATAGTLLQELSQQEFLQLTHTIVFPHHSPALLLLINYIVKYKAEAQGQQSVQDQQLFK
ncbi:hypothetical protein SmJEL517_g01284 [Synchytrium microbalum]|uniref:Uncharacterized protein n=1 Tax=Synchytrium microbalum TaxID=1806994 RepID=A0A507C6R8_9FUNG|nr:uncharacterized protein SmJEL517_g01284 [Synchytrium microbalum]TPX36737.1 hypothetical protein SmJEL517_g01284 [Synchytrium microbalum]